MFLLLGSLLLLDTKIGFVGRRVGQKWHREFLGGGLLMASASG
jgi:hypothetical protein